MKEIKRWIRLLGYALALLLPGVGVFLYMRGKKRGAQDARTEVKASNAEALGDTLKARQEAARQIAESDAIAAEQHKIIDALRASALAEPHPTADDAERLEKQIAEIEGDLLLHRSQR